MTKDEAGKTFVVVVPIAPGTIVRVLRITYSTGHAI